MPAKNKSTDNEDPELSPYISLKESCASGRISTKETYIITPAAKDILNESNLVFLILEKNTIKPPIAVANPAHNEIIIAITEEFSISLQTYKYGMCKTIPVLRYFKMNN